MGKSTSLPLADVVRVGDEDPAEIAAGGVGMRFFSIWARCAMRVTGAHRAGVRWWLGLGLGAF